MFCEICGREIVGKPGRSLVEGATLIVCQQCSKLGTALPGFPDKPVNHGGQAHRPMIAPSHTHAPIERLPKAIEETDLLEDYSSIIKMGREKLGMSQQDLAFKAKEKLTVIQKIEIGKMLPTMRLSKELEHILRIKLLAPRDEIELPAPRQRTMPAPTMTLGDIALVKNKEESDD